MENLNQKHETYPFPFIFILVNKTAVLQKIKFLSKDLIIELQSGIFELKTDMGRDSVGVYSANPDAIYVGENDKGLVRVLVSLLLLENRYCMKYFSSIQQEHIPIYKTQNYDNGGSDTITLYSNADIHFNINKLTELAVTLLPNSQLVVHLYPMPIIKPSMEK